MTRKAQDHVPGAAAPAGQIPATVTKLARRKLAIDEMSDSRQPLLNLLLVEDDDSDAELILTEFESAGLPVHARRAINGEEFQRALVDTEAFDAVLCDYQVPGLDVFGAIDQLHAAGLTIPLIVVSGRLTDETATDCMRLGAADYVIKDRMMRLPHALSQAVSHERAERSGREAELRFSRLFNDLPVAVFGTTYEGRLQHANPAMIAMFGCDDLEAMLVMSINELHVDPADRAELLRRLETEGQVLDFECRMRRLDGSEFWFSRDVHAVRQGGQIIQLESIGRDISESKGASLELAKSEARLRSLLMSAPVGFTTVDSEGCITFGGGSLYEKAGIDPASLIGLSLTEAFGNRQDFADIWKRALREDVNEELQFGGRSYQIRSQPFRLEPGGNVMGVFVVTIDDTDRVESARALQVSEEIFRALFDQSSVGIALLDIPRNGSPVESRWNERIRSMMGVEGVDDDSWISVFGVKTRSELLAKFTALLTGKADHLRERREHIRPDHTSIWMDLSTIVVRDAAGEAVRWQTLALDISEQVQAEELLARRAAKETVLLEITRAGLDGQPTAAFLARAIELVARGMDAQFGTILQLLPDGHHLARVAAHGRSRPVPAESTPIDIADVATEHVTSLLRKGKSAAFTAQPHSPLSAWMVECGVVASLGVGVSGPLTPFGVLAVHLDTPREFSPEEFQFMESAAAIVAIAIERRQSEEQRRLLLARLVTAQEEERRLIAGDIHDDAVQMMAAGNMRLELFRRMIVDPDQLQALEKLQQTISLATSRLRNLLFELNPPDLERHGLAEALRRHLDQYREATGVPWTLQDELTGEPSGASGILLFRIFQEALTNIRKHADPETVNVMLEMADEGVSMTISDDGSGFVTSSGPAEPGHLGLASMRERAEIAGGWWRLTSEPGKGTEIQAWVPLPTGQRALAPPAPETIVA